MITRRTILRASLGATAGLATPRAASALDYPVRPIHVLVGTPPGLAPDIIARLIGEALSPRLGQQVVIDNRPGAGTNIATEAAIRATPDGYTLLLANPANAINASLYPNLNFNFLRDSAPVASICSGSFVMVVNPSLPVHNVGEFIAYAKAHPGKINMASAGNGTTPHLFGELFKMMTGADFVHVPYRSSYVPDLVAGRVQFAFTSLSVSLQLIRTGKLRALAVTTAKRSAELPDVPAMREFVPGYEASSWYGMSSAKGAPEAAIDTLNRQTNAALADANLKARLDALGFEPAPMTPARFGKLIAEETAKWGNVVRTAKIKAD